MTPSAPRRFDRAGRWLLLATVLAALVPRLWVVVGTTYSWDEDRDWIQIARGISFDPADPHIPIREGQHGALAAYFVRAGAEIVGPNPVGYRLFGLLAGLLTVGLATWAGYRWGGLLGGAVAGGLLAFNEYHIAFSAIAIARIYALAFALGALVAFAVFLETDRSRPLYLAAALAGIAFLFKETSALLLPACAIVLIVGRTSWLRRKDPWLALLLFVAIISPDLWWQLEPTSTGVERGYADHLGRITGLGITYQPMVLYFRGAIEAALEAIGRPFVDVAREYPTMNVAFGALLVGAAGIPVLFRRFRPSAIEGVLLGVFWSVMLFFALIETRAGESGMDPIAWNWADITLLPAVLLAALTAARLPRRALLAAGAVALLGVVISGVRVAGYLDRDRVAVGSCPETLAADEGFVPVAIVVQTCPVCGDEWSRLALQDVVMAMPEGAVTVLGTERVRGADVGEMDREIELSTALLPDGRGPTYGIAFETGPTPRGRRIGVETSVWVGGVPFRPRFWTCDAP